MNSSLMTYSIGHFAVDFSCGFMLYTMYVRGDLEAASVPLLFLVYNLIAFGAQYIIGAAGDFFKSNGRVFAIAGCLLTVAGLVAGDNYAEPYLVTVLIGLGNAAYHVGGGTDALTRDAGMTRAGIFVSTGSLGIAMGCHAGESGHFNLYFAVAVLLFVACAIYIFCRGARRIPHIPEATEQPGISAFRRLLTGGKPLLEATLPAALILLAAVLIRSWAGFIAVSPGSDSKFAYLLPAAAAFGGKFLGGVLADLLGARRTGTVAVLLSVPLLWLGASSYMLFLAGLFFFNIAMPITLVGLSRRFPSHEGFAFGLTTLMLVVGYILSSYLELTGGTARIIVAVTSVIAAAGIFLTVSDVRPPLPAASGSREAETGDGIPAAGRPAK